MDKKEMFINYMVRFNNFVMLLLSGLVCIIGIITFQKYDICSIEFLLCISLTLIAYNYMFIYGSK
jgi:hypothetical protein